MRNIEETIWKFVRADINASEFEKWVYCCDQLQEFLGEEIYLKVLEAGYVDKRDVYELRTMLRQWLEQNTQRACDCFTWSNHQVIPLGYDTSPERFFEQFNVIKERNPWLELVRCKVCGQNWYIATDTVDDDYHLARLSQEETDRVVSQGIWPDTFDKIRNVWPDGTDNNGV